MKRTSLALAACVLGGALLSGCSETQGDLGNRNIRPESVKIDGNGNPVIDKRFANDQKNEMNRIHGRQLNSNNLIGSHQNYRLEMSQDIAADIDRMDEVAASYVMLTDINAYVAYRPAGSAHAEEPSNAAEPEDAAGYPGMDGAAEIGRDTDPLRHGMGLRSTRTQTREGLAGADGRAFRRGSRAAAPNGAAAGVESRIAAEIHRMAPQIERAYISDDSEFVERLAHYEAIVRDGRPIQGHIAEFNAMVERLFPAASGIELVEPRAIDRDDDRRE